MEPGIQYAQTKDGVSISPEVTYHHAVAEGRVTS